MVWFRHKIAASLGFWFRLIPGGFRSMTCLTLALVSGSAQASETDEAEPSVPQTDLLGLSWEELGQIKVTSVSRKSERLSTAAAAIHVIPSEEIRRSGVTTLAEALRMAPGVQVAQANSRQWAISARGFNGIFASALLVSMDGRTLYTPLFSGVFWEEADTVLEDLDRIEVIRGPGAALWGANAVNGVINFISKRARDTQGVLVSAGGGLEERGFGVLRYGGQLSTNAHYRVYTKYSDRDEFTSTGGHGTSDAWSVSKTGMRLDWDSTPGDQITLQSDYYYGHLGGRINRLSLSPPGLKPTPARGKVEGANVLSRWTHDLGPESEVSVQTYYDRTDRSFGVGREIRDTVDFDAQHRFPVGDRNEIVWGSGYRYSVDDITESPEFQIGDPHVGLQLFSVFAQDEIKLIPDRFHLTLGTKLEHNDFTGFELQPSGRLTWTPNERHTVWGAVSRAMRTPSRSERGIRYFVNPPLSAPVFPLPLLIHAQGNPDFGSEELLAYELGYRVQIHPRLSLDSTVFYHDYDRLWAGTILPLQLEVSPSGEPYVLLPAEPRNDLFGETYGLETSAVWQPIPTWRLQAAYTFLAMSLHTRGAVRSLAEDTEISNPRNQVSLRSELDLGRHVEWGMGLRYVDSLPGLGIPSYVEMDARLAWKVSTHCEIALIGRNLLDSHHPEAVPSGVIVGDVEVDRSVHGKITWKF